MNQKVKGILLVVLSFSLLLSFSALSETTPWDCPECGRTGNTGNYCGGCAHPAPWISDDGLEEQTKDVLKFDYSVGDIITLGLWEQDNNYSNGSEEIEWIILDNDERGFLILSKYGLKAGAYTDWNTPVTWETSPLRTWLNDSFYNTAFSEIEKDIVLSVKNDNGKSQGNPSWQTDGGNDTTDRIFLLSYAEYIVYYQRLKALELEAVSPTPYAKANGAWIDDRCAKGQWFLRSPGDIQANVAHVDQFGNVGASVGGGWDCIRPALWISK